MNEDITLRFDDEFMLDSAQKRFDEGDYFGALRILNKREALNDPIADAYEIYADIYEALGLWPLAADAWFRFLDTCAREEFSDGFEGLAVAFMNMGNDLQSGYYYHRAVYGDEEQPEEGPPTPSVPVLRLVHDADAGERSPELISEGLDLLKSGDLAGAREVFADIPETSEDFASGAGLSAMCTLMMGDETAAEEQCAKLMERYPDNVQVLTTYCAVLGAVDKNDEAKEVARRLARLDAKKTDDLYRIATALCETELHAEAYEKLKELRASLPYDENVLWFFAVAAYKTDRTDEAVEALETLTLLYPRKYVAAWYLSRLRMLLDGGERVPMTYYYRLPESEYRNIAAYLLEINGYDEDAREVEVTKERFRENFRLAFDEMEGRDEKLQLLASKVAARCRADSLLRAALLDRDGDDIVKLSILHDLVCRNEEDSFGTVICDLYREIFTHRIEIGRKCGGAFMLAFADVYAKYALIGEVAETKICNAGEDIYASVAEAGEWELMNDRSALAAAIYREARIPGGERSIGEICKLFGADEAVAKRILELMI